MSYLERINDILLEEVSINDAIDIPKMTTKLTKPKPLTKTYRITAHPRVMRKLEAIFDALNKVSSDAKSGNSSSIHLELHHSVYGNESLDKVEIKEVGSKKPLSSSTEVLDIQKKATVYL